MTHPPQEQLDRFETQLLTSLREEVAGRGQAAPRRRRFRRRWSAAGVGVAAAAAVTAALVLQPAGAYAVDRQGDGDVVVTIRSLKDADGLERALRDEGVEAEVDYDPNPIPNPADEPPGTDATQSDGDRPTLDAKDENGQDTTTPAEDGTGCSMSIGVADDGVTFRISSEIVESDAVLFITTSGEAELGGIQIGWKAGTGPC